MTESEAEKMLKNQIFKNMMAECENSEPIKSKKRPYLELNLLIFKEKIEELAKKSKFKIENLSVIISNDSVGLKYS